MVEDFRKGKGMRLIILDILHDEKLHGYGISEKIYKIYGVKKPSSGIIYPVLSNLRKKGFVEVCEEGKRDKKIYRITPAGVNYLNENSDGIKSAKRMLRNLGEFYRIGGDTLIEEIKNIVKNIHRLSKEDKDRLSYLLSHTSKEVHEIINGEIHE